MTASGGLPYTRLAVTERVCSLCWSSKLIRGFIPVFARGSRRLLISTGIFFSISGSTCVTS